MAWNYARYVNTVVEAGKKEYDLPMYVNAWPATAESCLARNLPERRPGAPGL